ncbi:hypothetical protein, conserved [Eimeria tenella]|uniref:Uncharacterized protein n=1 Tax=Eimeria tenella TaxID=5802 RepID=U6KTD4_EIMTE|nr:hypothetical protein, conserved [Eimeria tenella]CDJ40188.1 hypothetical protein, conserved [Eimeria tenella]|eukprot:XP_013230941.1 hypothetical protein, conserved [Eimeria tenella]
MASRNLLAFVGGDSPAEKIPQAKPLPRLPLGSSDDLTATNNKGPSSGATREIAPDMSSVWSKAPEFPKRLQGSGSRITTLRECCPAPGELRERLMNGPLKPSLEGPLSCSGLNGEVTTPANTKRDLPETPRAEPLTGSEIWDFPLAPPGEIAQCAEEDREKPYACEAESGQEQQDQEEQQQPADEKQKAQQQQVPPPSRLSVVPVHTSPTEAVPEETLQEAQQKHQLLETDTDEVAGEMPQEMQQMQQSQSRGLSKERGSLRCLSVFSSEPDEGFASAPNTGGSRSPEDGQKLPDGAESWGWLSPIATETDP